MTKTKNRFGISNNPYAPNSEKNFFSPRGAVSQFVIPAKSRKSGTRAGIQKESDHIELSLDSGSRPLTRPRPE